VLYGVDFNEEGPTSAGGRVVGRNVVVVGGGYTAMELRADEPALRRRQRDHRLPAHPASELVVDEGRAGRETQLEGVRMDFLVSPIELLGRGRQADGDPVSSATSWASRTHRAAARRCRSRAPSSRFPATPSSRPSRRPPNYRFCRLSPLSEVQPGPDQGGSRDLRLQCPRGVCLRRLQSPASTTLIESAGHGKKAALIAIDRYLDGRHGRHRHPQTFKITSSWRQRHAGAV